MSSDYQKVYNCRLKVHGPVFIGNGREITKKEYIFLDRRNSIGIINSEKFYFFLQKRGLSVKYEDFLLHEKRLDLFSWLREVDVKLEEVVPYLKYRIPVGDLELDRGRAKWTVLECIKDPYGLPYVPGSSIKGMLRTVLLSGYIHGKRSKNMMADSIMGKSRETGFKPRRDKYLLRESKELEAEVFNTLNKNERKKEDAVNDSLSGLIISDSKPLSFDDMVMCQKVDLHIDGKESRLNLMRECIRPGTDIFFTITIDSSICGESGESINSAIDGFDKMYEECFLSSFPHSTKLPDKSVFIGGGSGYVSKTAAYPLFGKDEGVEFVQRVFENTGVPREHKHSQDMLYGISPHILKCTKINGKRYQMGLCTLEIK